MEYFGFTPNIVKNENFLLSDLHNIVLKEETFYKKRFGIQWVKEGDKKHYVLPPISHYIFK